MKAAVKIVGGLVLVILSLYYIFKGFPFLGLSKAWPEVLALLKGAIPLVVLVLGVFIIWLEWDEIKIERELEEEKKTTKRKKKA